MYRDELEFAWRAAVEVAGFIREVSESGDLRVQQKGDGSPVTIADRGAEERLRVAIEQRFPADGILGEEYGEKPGTSGRRWILDPIDGTKSFVHGVPLCGTLVALEVDGEAVVGVISMPLLDELVAAARGEGAFWWPRVGDLASADSRRRAARVSRVSALAEATLCLTSPRHFITSPARTLADQVALVRGWGDCYGHLLVATGRADIQLDPAMHVWDNAALQPILEEAGGRFTSWSGEATHLGDSAVTTNGLLHDVVLEHLKV